MVGPLFAVRSALNTTDHRRDTLCITYRSWQEEMKETVQEELFEERFVIVKTLRVLDSTLGMTIKTELMGTRLVLDRENLLSMGSSFDFLGLGEVGTGAVSSPSSFSSSSPCSEHPQHQNKTELAKSMYQQCHAMQEMTLDLCLPLLKRQEEQ
ncbi:hypothetical protein JHK84_048014 [Glycine max]|nr:hypothetical protein JHK84_048014 [Glycine max]